MKILALILAVYLVGVECNSPCEPNPCKNKGVCTTDGTNFKCTCTQFFVGPVCDKAAENFGRGMLMEKKMACAPDPCLNEGQCSDLGSGKFECSCPWGYIGARCEICITDCASNPCPSNKKCKAKFGGGFQCVCPADSFGDNCEIQNDVCSEKPCRNGGVCKPEENGLFSCKCVEPFTGETCDKIWQSPCTSEVLLSQEIVQFKNPWNTRGFLVCTNINEHREMLCSKGTEYNDNLKQCVPFGYIPPVCPVSHCENLGQCIIDEDNEAKCVCKPGFAGDRCEVNIDDCKGHDACGMNGECIDQIDGYYCKCQGNKIGLNCNSANTMENPCTVTNLNKGLEYFAFDTPSGDSYVHCLDQFSWIVSRCASGLFWNSKENTCTEEKSLVLTGTCAQFPCHNNGECVDLGGAQYRCECRKGYSGENCETMIDYCSSNPCQNGGRCLAYAGGYTCMCPDNIVDDCCCHGVLNPCPERDFLIPGINNYFPHLFPNKYFHCDFDGKAFVRSCALGTKWFQDFLTCRSPEIFETIEDVVVPPTKQPASYQSYEPEIQSKFVQQKPLYESSYKLIVPQQQQQQQKVVEQIDDSYRSYEPFKIDFSTFSQSPEPIETKQQQQQIVSYGQQETPTMLNNRYYNYNNKWYGSF